MRVQRIVAALAISAATVTLSACGSSQSSSPTTSSPTTSSMATSTAEAPAGGAATDQPFGSACGAVPASGPGSFSGMAADPVATAASNNPVLSTLVSAVKKAGLVDTLNSAKDITVFAPYNGAFGKIPAATLDKVLADKTALTKLLTYHVVGQRITPAELASGTFKTLEGATIGTTGSGEEFKINGTASVICGNVQTANATVYIIDTVLMPPAS